MSGGQTPYIVLEKLGEGTYATVHKVSRKHDLSASNAVLMDYAVRRRAGRA